MWPGPGLEAGAVWAQAGIPTASEISQQMVTDFESDWDRNLRATGIEIWGRLGSKFGAMGIEIWKQLRQKIESNCDRLFEKWGALFYETWL